MRLSVHACVGVVGVRAYVTLRVRGLLTSQATKLCYAAIPPHRVRAPP